MTFLWATRGRSWGYRFLRTGGFADPLPVYDSVFSDLGDEPELFRRVGDKVALRFEDPELRADASGRVIPHEFVILEPLASQIHSLEEAKRLIWEQVKDEFTAAWDQPTPRVTQCR